MVVEKYEQVPFISTVRLLPDPLGLSMRNRSHTRKKKEPAPPPLEDEETGSMIMIPNYIPPRSDDVPKITILNNEMCPQVALTVPK